jgi:hypothetical protein
MWIKFWVEAMQIRLGSEGNKQSYPDSKSAAKCMRIFGCELWSCNYI